MATTSLKLPDDMKELVAAAAKREGISPHAFMVNAVSAAAVNARKRAQFIADATASRQQAIRDGTGYQADEVHAWLRAKSAGRPAHKPDAATWRK